MSEYRYPLAATTWDQIELDAMQEVIESGRFTMGEKVAAFERDFAACLGSRFAVMVNSGSSANLLMIAALFYTSSPELRLERGDEVIVPAVSWGTTYFPLQQYGLRIRFVDVDLETLNLDTDEAEAAMSDRTRVILAVNLLGNPNEFDRIAHLMRGRDIILLEDNCESLGAEYRERKCGTMGVMSSHSCFFSHHISTMEGGVVVTDDEELYHVLLALRAHGWTRNLPKTNLVTGRKSDDAFEESFRFVLPGYNLRPLELSGAVGIEQIRKFPSLLEKRRENARYLQETMSDHPQILIQREVGASSWFGFSLVIRPGADLLRTDLIASLEAMGFECRPVVAGNFTRNPVVRYLDADIPKQLPNADRVHTHGLFIGNHHFDIRDGIERIAGLFRN